MIKVLIPVLIASTTTMIVSIIMLTRNYTFSELVLHIKKLSPRLYMEVRQILIRIRIPELMNRLRIPEAIALLKPKIFKTFQSIPWSKISNKIKQLIRITRLKKILNNLNYSDWVSRFSLRFLRKTEAQDYLENSAKKDSDTFNCRVRLKNKNADSNIDIFTVQICGSIQIYGEDSKNKTANLKISILDITSGIKKVSPVQTLNRQYSTDGQMQQSAFVQKTSLGKLIHQVTTISDWATVSQIPLDGLFFPRKGQRELQFEISVFIEDTNQELANAKCTIVYENPMPGYLDLKENIERTKTMTVALAFSVGAADGKLNDGEIELIKNWSLNNFMEYSEGNTEKEKRKICKALDKTATFFHKGNRLNVQKICVETAQISPIGQRYEIIKLCLKITQAKETIGTEVVTMLKDMADWLELDNDRLRLMMQKFLPVNTYEGKNNIETILGITSDMSKEIARKKLNREYSKWNARVTNSDPNIQTQADQMLKLIAEVRNQYITK